MLNSLTLNADGECSAGDEQKVQFDTRIAIQIATIVIVMLDIQGVVVTTGMK